jgi:glucan phosphoethanolaminetransferase (alkaline phosphatase superfamily)
LRQALNYATEGKGENNALRALPSPATLSAALTWDEPLIIVFFVGESLRADHLGINGYERNTTPRLAQEHLVNFPYTTASAAWTREALIGVFTDRLPDSQESNYGSFVKIFQKLGYQVTTYSASTKPNKNDYSMAILTEGARRFYVPGHDLLLVERMAEELGKDGLLELHILFPRGSHFSYRDRYPPSEAAFTPDNYKKPLMLEELPLIINSYDNTVLYTDKVIHAAIELLRDKKAVFVFIGDHGESLGEEGRFFHGVDNKSPEQLHVPLFFWFSDSYRAAHPEIIAALEARTSDSVHHSHIFHTMLGIAGIESQVRDSARDLTQALPE